MALDLKIEEAIKVAVSEAGQSLALAQKLIAWMNAVTSGNENVNDQQAAQRHLDLLYEETKLDSLEEDPL